MRRPEFPGDFPPLFKVGDLVVIHKNYRSDPDHVMIWEVRPSESRRQQHRYVVEFINDDERYEFLEWELDLVSEG